PGMPAYPEGRRRFPESVRERLVRLGQYEPMRTLGAGYYRAASRAVAAFLARDPAVESVWLRGAVLHDCQPRVSDLDLIVRARDELSDPELEHLLERLRTANRRIPRLLFPIDDLACITPRSWRLIVRLLPMMFELPAKLHRYADGRWQPALLLRQ